MVCEIKCCLNTDFLPWEEFWHSLSGKGRLGKESWMLLKKLFNFWPCLRPSPGLLVNIVLLRSACAIYSLSGLDKLRARWWACMQRACKEILACTKLRARKSNKIPLSSAPMLFKVISFFVFKSKQYSVQYDLTFTISFSWEVFVKYSYI